MTDPRAPDPRTVAAYDARAGDYAARFGDDVPPDLAPFAALLPPSARVLDLGCGPGHVAEWLAARGHEAHAWDASAAMVARAAARPGVRARQATFEEVEGEWHGIWAAFSLLHAPRADLSRLLRRLCGALRPGGALLVAMKTGEGERRDALGRRYSYLSEAELRDHLERGGLRIVSTRTGAEAGLAGAVEPHVAITAQAPA